MCYKQPPEFRNHFDCITLPIISSFADVLLLHGVDVIAKFALVLILDHKRELMACTGLEAVMECFKLVVTNITSDKLDKYLKKVLESDWDKQLLTYCVEYSVMNDEAFHAFMSDSSASSNAIPGRKSGTTSDRGVQTLLEANPSPPPVPATNGEKHPIFGDLIQRQNTEIAKLQKVFRKFRKRTIRIITKTFENLAA